jgi:tRNA U34 5-methylaminomethyl-2-thiouridine-forming methyltransferase MnmC
MRCGKFTRMGVILTEDGSHTIKNETTGDTYHSIHGAVQESQHVFIKSGLGYFLSLHPRTEINILEVGFGTGLNALLTQAVPGLKIEYTSLEPYPLSEEVYRALNYEPKETLLALHQCEWDSSCSITKDFILTKLESTLSEAKLPENHFDVVYFDAFAPNSQPELWTQGAFAKIKSAMATPSVFVTYCAKGQVKRDLKAVGFHVESIPGPPGKREMIRATPT